MQHFNDDLLQMFPFMLLNHMILEQLFKNDSLGKNFTCIILGQTN